MNKLKFDTEIDVLHNAYMKCCQGSSYKHGDIASLESNSTKFNVYRMSV